MRVEPKSLLESAAEWFSTLYEALRSVMASPALGEAPKAECAPTTDPDFEGWLVNDLSVMVNPASRYADDGSGLLATAEVENSDLAPRDD